MSDDRCKSAVGSGGTRLSFKAGQEPPIFLQRVDREGQNFKFLGAVFDLQLIMRAAVSAMLRKTGLQVTAKLSQLIVTEFR